VIEDGGEHCEVKKRRRQAALALIRALDQHRIIGETWDRVAVQRLSDAHAAYDVETRLVRALEMIKR